MNSVTFGCSRTQATRFGATVPNSYIVSLKEVPGQTFQQTFDNLKARLLERLKEEKLEHELTAFELIAPIFGTARIQGTPRVVQILQTIGNEKPKA